MWHVVININDCSIHMPAEAYFFDFLKTPRRAPEQQKLKANAPFRIVSFSIWHVKIEGCAAAAA